MIVKLFEAGEEIKSYNSFDSVELQAILKDKDDNHLHKTVRHNLLEHLTSKV